VSKRIVIDESGIFIEGFDPAADVPEADVLTTTFMRAMLRGIKRIVDVTNHAEARQREKSLAAAQAMQATELMRKALH
jgi:hypothetical protein